MMRLFSFFLSMMELVRGCGGQERAEKCSSAWPDVEPAASCIVKNWLWGIPVMAIGSRLDSRAGRLSEKTAPAKVSNSCDKGCLSLARS
jgi:hypothetical protein